MTFEELGDVYTAMAEKEVRFIKSLARLQGAEFEEEPQAHEDPESAPQKGGLARRLMQERKKKGQDENIGKYSGFKHIEV